MATGGLYGNTTVTTNTFFTWFIYIQSASQPATPTGGTWSFVTNTGTPPVGWLSAPPTNPTNLIWVSTGFVSSQSSTISWSTPSQFSSTASAGITFPASGIANSTGVAWGTSYSVTGTGTSVVLAASPTLTGTPLAPTAATFTNTTQIATTAFVQTALGTGSLPLQAGFTGYEIQTNGTTASWSLSPASAIFLATNFGAL